MKIPKNSLETKGLFLVAVNLSLLAIVLVDTRPVVSMILIILLILMSVVNLLSFIKSKR